MLLYIQFAELSLCLPFEVTNSCHNGLKSAVSAARSSCQLWNIRVSYWHKVKALGSVACVAWMFLALTGCSLC